MTTPEQKALREKWIAALRSGEYKQGIGQLHKDDCFCGLGVLCDIVNPDGWVPHESKIGLFMFSSCTGFLPERIRVAVGLKTNLGYFFKGEVTKHFTTALAFENDAGATFSEIAEIIESKPKGLFE